MGLANQTILFDLETDGIEYTKIHCIAACTEEDPAIRLFTDVSEFERWAGQFDDPLWVAHNGCGFDMWVVNELTSIHIPEDRIRDTSVLSKLADYNKYITHSLKEIGLDLGVHKGEYTGDWTTYTQEMGDYCKQDVAVLRALWRKFKHIDKNYPEASMTEHTTAIICEEIRRNGFNFNKSKAEQLLEAVRMDMDELEVAMRKEWPAQLVEDRRIQWRVTKDGNPYATCTKAMAEAPAWERDGDELVLFKWKEFNPGSPIDRIDKLWDAGWSPYDKTKGHIKFERERRER